MTIEKAKKCIFCKEEKDGKYIRGETFICWDCSNLIDFMLTEKLEKTKLVIRE